MSSPVHLNKTKNTIDIQNAKRALATLQEERRAQQDRLQLAAQTKQQLDQTIAQRTHSVFSRKECLMD